MYGFNVALIFGSGTVPNKTLSCPIVSQIRGHVHSVPWGLLPSVPCKIKLQKSKNLDYYFLHQGKTETLDGVRVCSRLQNDDKLDDSHLAPYAVYSAQTRLTGEVDDSYGLLDELSNFPGCGGLGKSAAYTKLTHGAHADVYESVR